MATDAHNAGVYDLAIVGGGINGCGIARDAAGRGHSVYLCEQADLASGTSSASTKLIHGGLRYLEHYEFRLVRESLLEREVLWAMAPHIIRPLRFVLPHHHGLRPAWMLRLGLFVYDHLGGRKRLPATRRVDLTTAVEGQALAPGQFTTGFAYSDCWVDDARLVVLNACDAAARGAVIATRTALIAARREGDLWHATVEDRRTGAQRSVRARGLVNAAGPWMSDVLATRVTTARRAPTRLVQGAHIVVPKLFDHASCYLFQTGDGRIVFAIPYESDFTLIGTTDREFHGDPAQASINDEEVAYLCTAASHYFAKPVTADSIVWTYAGVRSLVDDGADAAQEATRDYVLDLDTADGAAPLLSVIGGKITTYRRLAEQALEMLAPSLPAATAKPAGWTACEALPGGDFSADHCGDLVRRLRVCHPFVGEALAVRLVRTYGTRAATVLGGARSAGELGEMFGATLSAAEVGYLRREEFAETAEDILWRRTKLGLKMSLEERRAVADYLATHPLAHAAAP